MNYRSPELAAAVQKLHVNGGSTPTRAPLVDNVASVAWPAMDDAAYHGLAGKIVRTLEPHTEADPVAILLPFLAMFGNVIGPQAHFQVEGDHHRAKLFVALSGATAKGRKGTALGRVRQILAVSSPDWEQNNINTGLSSGEGVIFHVRDAVTRLGADSKEEIVDRGALDKRLMLVTEEFAGALSVMERTGNTLSSILRDAWGTSQLQTLTKTSPIKATGSHISIVAHITDDELRSKLNKVEMANGFANRFLLARVRRSKELPHGGQLDAMALQKLGEEVAIAVENATRLGRLTMTPEASRVWEAVYHHLSAGRPGLLGAILGRAEPQTLRLAVIYAALDNSQHIEVAHLRAALAIWQYCEDSATQIFGQALGDEVADTILASLTRAGSAGLSRTEISALFARHISSVRIAQALRFPPSTWPCQTRGRADCWPSRGKVVSHLRGRAMKYLDLARSACERSEESEIRGGAPQPTARQESARSAQPGLNSLISLLSHLEARCPEYIEVADWQQAVEDGRRFLANWGEQAADLGWTSRDLLGLHRPPDRPGPTYRRLSRYDETGLIWLLRGRPVVELTAETAAVQSPAGSVTVYRRHNKPGLGPVGDSLDDLTP